jgi:uncharacterized protein (DUF488 family)
MAEIFTIGHSTRSFDAFLEVLTHADVERVVDVRAIPRSRRYPQYDQDAFARRLAEHGIGYTAVPELGGRRNRSSDVPADVNAFWQNRGFHNYADHAHSAEFAAGIERLLDLARDERCAILCAEAVWWRCHRRIIADYLLERGVAVHHLLEAGKIEPARQTEAATPLPGGRLAYPRRN